jgi:hypothetical protein
MTNPIRFTLLAGGLAAQVLHASEVGLLLDKQFGSSLSLSAFRGAPPIFKIDASNPTGFGFRGAYSFLNSDPIEYGFTATYHPKVRTSANLIVVWNPAVIPRTLETSYASLGVQADWKTLLNLHLGLDLRRDTISSDHTFGIWGAYGSSVIFATPGTTRVTRPWISAGCGLSSPAPAFTPFIRLEAAYALKTFTPPVADATGDDFRKALAPKYLLALYGGVRF